MLNTNAEEKFFHLMDAFRIGMLVTQDINHTLRSRPMAVAQFERNGVIWFITSVESGKVHEIQSWQNVHVTFQDGTDRFVAISGQAELIRDRAKIDMLWKESFKTWFPTGKSDPDIVLIKVKIEDAEYWDNEGINKVKYLFESVKAYVTGTPPEVGDREQHASIKMK